MTPLPHTPDVAANPAETSGNTQGFDHGLSLGVKIGEVAELSGLSVKTIRFYCDQGLIQPQSRTEGGYRLFDHHIIAELTLIRTLKSIDMPLSQIKKVLEVRRSGICNCSKLKNSLNHKVQAIDKKIEDLNQMQHELKRLLKSWQDCGGAKSIDVS